MTLFSKDSSLSKSEVPLNSHSYLNSIQCLFMGTVREETSTSAILARDLNLLSVSRLNIKDCIKLEVNCSQHYELLSEVPCGFVLFDSWKMLSNRFEQREL